MAATIHRVGVLGDVHGEHARLGAALDWFAGQRLDAVICTGDVADGPGCINRCCTLLQEAGVLAVAGNHDRWLLEDRVRHVPDAHQMSEVAGENLDYLRALPRIRELETAAGALMLCHGVGGNDMAKVWPGTRGAESIRRSAALDTLLNAGRHRFIVHGHLHYRVLIDFEALLLMNAGTLKGARAGVSVVDFDAGAIAAYAFDGDSCLEPSGEYPLRPGPGRRVWRDTADFDGHWEPVLF